MTDNAQPVFTERSAAIKADGAQRDAALRLSEGADRLKMRSSRRGRVSQRLLILHRWIAVAGQTIAVLAVQYGLAFDVPLIPVATLIAASVLLNVVVMMQPRRPSRLDDRTATAYLAFDILQLSALLYLTGGLQNPFAVLMLAPVTVAATMLAQQAVIAIVSLAILCFSVLMVFHQPLPGPGDVAWIIPPIYLAGFWTALALACLFISAYVYLLEREARRMSDALNATQIALGREQQMSALGALAAAAAHELGSPLSTMRMIAKEIARDLPPDSELNDDVQLLISESDRCRHILTELSERPEPSSANPFDTMALPIILDEVAKPYIPKGIRFQVEIDAAEHSPPPRSFFGPEIQHGFGNIIQNAGQFAKHQVLARVHWTDALVSVVIEDDGPGFPPYLLDRLGEPYVSGRLQATESLGLGVFIAQTLLEGLGADLQFANKPTVGHVEVETRDELRGRRRNG
ncbi:MAG: ActS/PrrB/RegB family redox-sensitive histidine kinase, partial [Pseudomonadota bacterium]